MNRCHVYFGIFGGWGWECLDGTGEVVAESWQGFERYADCVEDARLKGFPIDSDPRAGPGPLRPEEINFSEVPMYRRILVPVDGSCASTRGLEHALGLARGARVKVCLLSVVDDTLVGSLMVQPSAVAQHGYVIHSMRELGEKALAEATVLAGRRRIKVEEAIVESHGRSVSEVIIAEAKRWRADVIVMGTHGRRGWNRLMLGSAAEGVLRGAPVPVLLVRGEEHEPDAVGPGERRPARSRRLVRPALPVQ